MVTKLQGFTIGDDSVVKFRIDEGDVPVEKREQHGEFDQIELLKQSENTYTVSEKFANTYQNAYRELIDELEPEFELIAKQRKLGER